jgi:hypothetical protein
MRNKFQILVVLVVGALLGAILQPALTEAASPAMSAVAGLAALGQVDITDAEAIRFVDEVIRPTAESMRALSAEIDAALVTWFAGINTTITNDASPILDDREEDGVSRLVGSDVVNFITQMAAYQTQMNQPGVASVISEPCVSRLEVR